MSLKTELSKLDKKQLIDLIADLYKKNKSVQEYLNFFIKPDEGGLFEKYKAKVYESFFPKRGFGYSLKQGKQAISDFKKLGPSEDLVADLMLFYVETGVEFTNDYGDIGVTFYSSLESTFSAALKMMKKEGVLDEFEDRAAEILKDTRNIGWDFTMCFAIRFISFMNDISNLQLKSRLIVMQDENHWVLHPQNALVWQGEFFKWLKETR